jgi:DNA-binding MarR family transcriptional regulator
MDLSRALVGLTVRSMASLDGAVTLPQLRALTVLHQQGPCMAGELAAGVGLHVSTITRLCDRLVALDLITRQTNPDNRRRVELTITPAGEALVETVWAARAEELRKALRALSTKQRECLRDVIEPVTQALWEGAAGGTGTGGW